MLFSKKVKFASYLLLLSLCLAVMCSCNNDGSTTDTDINSFINQYNLWSDPGLYQRKEYTDKFFLTKKRATKKLRKLLSPGCKISFEFSGGRIDFLTAGQFVRGLNRARFMTLTEQIILHGPVISEEDGRFLVTMTKAFRSGGLIEVADCELVIELSGNTLSISEIKRIFREPQTEEVAKVQAVGKSIPYNRRKGLGARYLGGGNFRWTYPSFSPNGRKIVFSSLRHNSSEIYMINVNGTGLLRLTKTKYWEVGPSFTPDGKSILFISDKDNYAGEPYLINTDGTNYRKLMPGYYGVSDAVYNPDGTYVAFTVQVGKARDIYVMKSNGSEIKRLTQTGRINSHLVFSPDGRTLYFRQKWYDRSKDPPRCIELYSINVDGTELRPLTHDREDKVPLGATEQYLLFVYDKELWWMARNGAKQECLVKGQGHASYDASKLLPNHRSVLFVDDREKSFIYNLYLKKLNGDGTIKQLTRCDEYCRSVPDVSPDGKHVVYIGEPKGQPRNGKGYLRIVDIDSGEIRTIGTNY